MRLLNGCLWCALALLIGFTPTSVAAQTQPEATSFDELQRVLEPGQKVVLRDAEGRKTKGKVAGLTASSITLLVRDQYGVEQRRVFREGDVTTINRTDSVWTGALIGLGAGFIANEIFVRHVCGPPGYDDECAAIATSIGMLTFVPGGAATGLLVDKAIGNQRLYRAPGGRAQLTVTPVVGRQSTAVRFSLTF